MDATGQKKGNEVVPNDNRRTRYLFVTNDVVPPLPSTVRRLRRPVGTSSVSYGTFTVSGYADKGTGSGYNNSNN